MSELVYIGNHADLAEADLLSAYREATRLRALVRALAGPGQDVEDAAFDLHLSNGPDDATGALLERWGRLVGEPRLGLTDNEYRLFVQARIQANLATGHTDELIDIFRTVTGAATVRHFNLFPGAYALVAFRDDPMGTRHRARVRALMGDIKPGGIGAVLIEAPTTPFTLDDGPGFDVGPLARII